MNMIWFPNELIIEARKRPKTSVNNAGDSIVSLPWPQPTVRPNAGLNAAFFREPVN